MKSIKEKADEIMYDCTGMLSENHPSILAAMLNLANEAQRWIPVEEELPPCSDEDLLLKGIDSRDVAGIVDIGYMHDSHDGKPHLSHFVTLGGVLISITHWRPIDRS